MSPGWIVGLTLLVMVLVAVVGNGLALWAGGVL